MKIIETNQNLYQSWVADCCYPGYCIFLDIFFYLFFC